MPNQLGSEKRVHRRKHRAGKSVRQRYERGIARTLRIVCLETVPILKNSLPILGDQSVSSSVTNEEPEQTFEEFLQSMEELLDSIN